MAKTITLEVVLDTKQAASTIRDLHDTLEGRGKINGASLAARAGGGVGASGAGTGSAVGQAEAFRIAFANAAQQGAQAAANALADPYATTRAQGSGVARGLAGALPAIGGAVGSAFGPVGTVAGYGAGYAAEAGVNYLANQSDSGRGAAEDQFQAMLGQLGAAGVDPNAAGLQPALQRMARTVGARQRRINDAKLMVNQYTASIAVGYDQRGIFMQ